MRKSSRDSSSPTASNDAVRAASESGLIVSFTPRNEPQRQALQLYEHNEVLFLLGAAGSGKTHVAVALALLDVARSGHTKKAPLKTIRLIRPTVEAGRTSLGYLPGELHEKLEPYAAPFRQIIPKVAFHVPPSILSVEAVQFVRGLTWEDCVVLIDEAQNLSYYELKLLLTRVGNRCKVIILGDLQQSDVNPTGDYATDLEEVVAKLEGTPGFGVIRFSERDIVRNRVVREVLRLLR